MLTWCWLLVLTVPLPLIVGSELFATLVMVTVGMGAGLHWSTVVNVKVVDPLFAAAPLAGDTPVIVLPAAIAGTAASESTVAAARRVTAGIRKVPRVRRRDRKVRILGSLSWS